ncbi:tRNA pseudouridine(38-40) synthase TruA [Echinimonas agarilytica]|uniref:tRNA pseudouridine synthase A n=1 Tax=Echinimonas agarilytica TaxID=1215918 RepID=A0AA41W622_9GAMM|nr:tRNA pseudouridine(38-40) synthase TruA [Echinimonas agarilytica]MCM2679243.1 tRNA pseudouridine(38-40) synthase TruA [Echinimonas agarilytica]
MRIALGIEYQGTEYCGWQRQNDVDSVQAQLERALSKIANEPLLVTCAGRTDTGVHGTGQVVHFDCEKDRGLRAWTLGVNTILPDDIAVRWAHPVNDDFHARFSATARRYRYIIQNQPLRPGILRFGVTHHHHPLDAQAMEQAATCLLGEHDFTSFRATQCQSKSPNRNIHHLKVRRFGGFVVVDVKANAFVHHMVRNIVGSLLLVGEGEKSAEWLKDVLEAKDRTIAAATSKPHGLYLVSVDYPEKFGLPSAPMGPLFLPDDIG